MIELHKDKDGYYLKDSFPPKWMGIIDRLNETQLIDLAKRILKKFKKDDYCICCGADLK